VKKFGHVLGAVSLPLELLFNEQSMLRPADELEAIFAKAGVKPGDTVIGYCYVGQRATAALFAARTLGHTVLLYDGSMDDWTRRDLPLETTIKK
jgi:thiosulfate/3-mercaptopyruvate sulfurtransferase